MRSAGGANGPVSEATKPCLLHSCRRRTCLIAGKAPAVTSPALLPGATKRSWPVAPIAGPARRRILRLTAPPHLTIGHRRGRGSSGAEQDYGRGSNPRAGQILRRLAVKPFSPLFRVGPFSRQAQAVCRAYTWPASCGPPRGLAGARAAPARADPRSNRLEALTGIARMPGLGRGPGSVAGRRWQPPPRPGSSSSRPAFRARRGPWDSRRRSGVVVMRSRAVSQGWSPARDCAGGAISSGVSGA